MTVEQIKAAITQLSLEEKADLARWFHDWSDHEWDRQMARDIATGKLDTLIAEADSDRRAGRLQDLP